MQLDVESLRTLLAVVDHGSMTRAAEHLHVTQSAVSWKIKRLEQRAGRVLLIREGRTVRLSRDGRALADEARSIVEAHDRAVARLGSSELAGRVRLGSNEEITASRLVSVLGRFNRVHPAAWIEVVVDSSQELAALVDLGEIDVAVIQVSDDERRPDDTVLWTEDLAWMTGSEAPYDEGPVPLVTFGAHCNYRAVSVPLLDDAGIEHWDAFAGQTTAGVKGAVEVGLGVAVLGSRFLGDDIVEWRPGATLGELPPMYQVARIDPHDVSPLATALVEAICAEVSEPALL
ncbi:MAG: LysR family transcriptional regulator [Ilumatobacter sp.]|uniref:LysR family transcriptional regulator n=1 Tax=Ilumatobacter sp. TaxID=1967498 RepID=UPI002627952B|nr:LysR family transcriptional regulator [Ilumatobacter sp.]MDJ0770045.1 LysR family transcriptional regulator [Ilumatobacter sp.]